MAKEKRQKKKATSRPQLAAAFFCESIIEDKKDGSLTVVRIVDTLNLALDPSTPPEFPSEAERLFVPYCGLVSFRTLDAPGEHVLRLEFESPSGKRKEVEKRNVTLTEAPQGGMNLVLRGGLQIYQGGLFRLHVILDDEEVTQMPLVILIHRAESPLFQLEGLPSLPAGILPASPAMLPAQEPAKKQPSKQLKSKPDN